MAARAQLACPADTALSRPQASPGADLSRAQPPDARTLPLAPEAALIALLVEERHAAADAAQAAAVTAAAPGATPSQAATRAAERAATLALFRGDVGAAAEALIAADALSAEFVNASAAAGHAAWAHLTAAYATRLEARGDAHAAALQWLALHDVRGAVGVLRRAGLARDALVLGTARLLPDDVLLPVLRAELGAAEENSGAFESAALCYAAAGQLQAAARALGRRAGDPAAAAAAAAVQRAAAG